MNHRISRLLARDLTVGYGDATVLDGLDLELRDGRVTTILGPNGCGKSTLLRTLARVLAPSRGSVILDGVELHRQPTRAVARLLAMLPQSSRAPAELRVRDLVAYGRFPHRAWYARLDAADRTAVASALTSVGLEPLADRPLETLSGGERQRAWIAMALAQETPLLLLDEPTTSLDVAHQLEVLELVRQLQRTKEKTVVMVLHDINLAARFSDCIVLMRDGVILATGTPQEVILADFLRDAYGVDGRVDYDRDLEAPAFVPYRSVGARPTGAQHR